MKNKTAVRVNLEIGPRNIVADFDISLDDEGTIYQLPDKIKQAIIDHFFGSNCEECGCWDVPFESECECGE